MLADFSRRRVADLCRHNLIVNHSYMFPQKYARVIEIFLLSEVIGDFCPLFLFSSFNLSLLSIMNWSLNQRSFSLHTVTTIMLDTDFPLNLSHEEHVPDVSHVCNTGAMIANIEDLHLHHEVFLI